MPRQKKDAKILNIKLATAINEKLERLCEESGQSKTVAVERFLDRCLDEYFEKPKKFENQIGTGSGVKTKPFRFLNKRGTK